MSAPQENTMNPRDARRVLNQANRSKKHTDNVVEKAAATFDRTIALGESNGFIEGLRELIRGVA